MTGRWSQLAGRPLTTERRGVFAAAACVVLLVAGGLTLTAGNEATAPAGNRSGRPGPGGAAAASVAPTLDAEPIAADVPEGDRATVMRQARRFLAGYLPYLYGQGSARSIRGGTVALRRRLANTRPRVSPATRKRRPRLVRLAAEPLDRRARWHVVATVADGSVARYPIELLITTSRSGGVRVAEVSSE